MKFIEHLINNRKWYILALGILWTAFIWGCPYSIVKRNIGGFETSSLFQNFFNVDFSRELYMSISILLSISFVLYFIFNKKWSKILYVCVSIAFTITMIGFGFSYCNGIAFRIYDYGLSIIYLVFNILFMILTFFIVFIENIKNKKLQPKKQSDKERIAELERQVEELKKDKEN